MRLETAPPRPSDEFREVPLFPRQGLPIVGMAAFALAESWRVVLVSPARGRQ